MFSPYFLLIFVPMVFDSHGKENLECQGKEFCVNERSQPSPICFSDCDCDGSRKCVQINEKFSACAGVSRTLVLTCVLDQDWILCKNIETNEKIVKINVNPTPVLIFFASSTKIFLGLSSSEIVVIDIASNSVDAKLGLKNTENSSGINQLFFIESRSRLISSTGTVIYIWNTKSYQLENAFKMKGWVTSIDADPTGFYLAVAYLRSIENEAKVFLSILNLEEKNMNFSEMIEENKQSEVNENLGIKDVKFSGLGDKVLGIMKSGHLFIKKLNYNNTKYLSDLSILEEELFENIGPIVVPTGSINFRLTKLVVNPIMDRDSIIIQGCNQNHQFLFSLKLSDFSYAEYKFSSSLPMENILNQYSFGSQFLVHVKDISKTPPSLMIFSYQSIADKNPYATLIATLPYPPDSASYFTFEAKYYESAYANCNSYCNQSEFLDCQLKKCVENCRASLAVDYVKRLCSPCEDGLFINDANGRSCEKCDKSCEACENTSTRCLRCKKGFLLVEILHICVDTCPSGFFKSKKLCIPCLNGAISSGCLIMNFYVSESFCEDLESNGSPNFNFSSLASALHNASSNATLRQFVQENDDSWVGFLLQGELSGYDRESKGIGFFKDWKKLNLFITSVNYSESAKIFFAPKGPYIKFLINSGNLFVFNLIFAEKKLEVPSAPNQETENRVLFQATPDIDTEFQITIVFENLEFLKIGSSENMELDLPYFDEDAGLESLLLIKSSSKNSGSNFIMKSCFIDSFSTRKGFLRLESTELNSIRAFVSNVTLSNFHNGANFTLDSRRPDGFLTLSNIYLVVRDVSFKDSSMFLTALEGNYIFMESVSLTRNEKINVHPLFLLIVNGNFARLKNFQIKNSVFKTAYNKIYSKDFDHKEAEGRVYMEYLMMNSDDIYAFQALISINSFNNIALDRIKVYDSIFDRIYCYYFYLILVNKMNIVTLNDFLLINDSFNDKNILNYGVTGILFVLENNIIDVFQLVLYKCSAKNSYSTVMFYFFIRNFVFFREIQLFYNSLVYPSFLNGLSEGWGSFYMNKFFYNKPTTIFGILLANFAFISEIYVDQDNSFTGNIPSSLDSLLICLGPNTLLLKNAYIKTMIIFSANFKALIFIGTNNNVILDTVTTYTDYPFLFVGTENDVNLVRINTKLYSFETTSNFILAETWNFIFIAHGDFEDTYADTFYLKRRNIVYIDLFSVTYTQSKKHSNIIFNCLYSNALFMNKARFINVRSLQGSIISSLINLEFLCNECYFQGNSGDFLGGVIKIEYNDFYKISTLKSKISLITCYWLDNDISQEYSVFTDLTEISWVNCIVRGTNSLGGFFYSKNSLVVFENTTFSQSINPEKYVFFEKNNEVKFIHSAFTGLSGTLFSGLSLNKLIFSNSLFYNITVYYNNLFIFQEANNISFNNVVFENIAQVFLTCILKVSKGNAIEFVNIRLNFLSSYEPFHTLLFVNGPSNSILFSNNTFPSILLLNDLINKNKQTESINRICSFIIVNDSNNAIKILNSSLNYTIVRQTGKEYYIYDYYFINVLSTSFNSKIIMKQNIFGFVNFAGALIDLSSNSSIKLIDCHLIESKFLKEVMLINSTGDSNVEFFNVSFFKLDLEANFSFNKFQGCKLISFKKITFVDRRKGPSNQNVFLHAFNAGFIDFAFCYFSFCAKEAEKYLSPLKGLLYTDSVGQVLFQRNNIYCFSTVGDDSCIVFKSTSAIISYSEFGFNRNKAGAGGVVLFVGPGSLTLADNVFLSNYATFGGVSAICGEGIAMRIFQNIFLNNYAKNFLNSEMPVARSNYLKLNFNSLNIGLGNCFYINQSLAAASITLKQNFFRQARITLGGVWHNRQSNNLKGFEGNKFFSAAKVLSTDVLTVRFFSQATKESSSTFSFRFSKNHNSTSEIPGITCYFILVGFDENGQAYPLPNIQALIFPVESNGNYSWLQINITSVGLTEDETSSTTCATHITLLNSSEFWNSLAFSLEINSRVEDPLANINKTIIMRDLIISLRNCEKGEMLLYPSGLCEPCQRGSFSSSREISGTSQCKACLDSDPFFCYGADFKTPKAGYWQASFKSDFFLKCPREESCPGDTFFAYTQDSWAFADIKAYLENDKSQFSSRYCEKGYRGALCAECEEGKGLSAGYVCSNCDDWRVYFKQFILILIRTILVWLGLKKALEASSNLADKGGKINREEKHQMVAGYLIKQVQEHFQHIVFLSFLPIDLPYSWKSSFALAVTSSSNDMKTIFSMDCVIKSLGLSKWLKTWYFSMFLLILFNTITFFVMGIILRKKGKEAEKKQKEGSQRLSISNMSFRQILRSKAGVIVSYIFLTNVVGQSEIFIKSFFCKQLGDEKDFDRLIADLSISCDYRSFVVVKWVVCLPVLLYVLVWLPSQLFKSLFSGKNELGSQKMLRNYAFFYYPYRSNRFYYEIIVFFKRILFLILQIYQDHVLISNDGPGSFINLVFVFFFYLLVYFAFFKFFKPYNPKSFKTIKHLESMSLNVLMITCLGVILWWMEKDLFFSGFLIVVGGCNLAYLIFWVGFYFFNIRLKMLGLFSKIKGTRLYSRIIQYRSREWQTNQTDVIALNYRDQSTKQESVIISNKNLEINESDLRLQINRLTQALEAEKKINKELRISNHLLKVELFAMKRIESGFKESDVTMRLGQKGVDSDDETFEAVGLDLVPLDNDTHILLLDVECKGDELPVFKQEQGMWACYQENYSESGNKNMAKLYIKPINLNRFSKECFKTQKFIYSVQNANEQGSRCLDVTFRHEIIYNIQESQQSGISARPLVWIIEITPDTLKKLKNQSFLKQGRCEISIPLIYREKLFFKFHLDSDRLKFFLETNEEGLSQLTTDEEILKNLITRCFLTKHLGHEVDWIYWECEENLDDERPIGNLN